MDVYDKIDEVLKKKHMSRRKLAIEAGIPESSLAASFARRSRMSPENLQRISKVLDISPLELNVDYRVLYDAIYDSTKMLEYIDDYKFHLGFIDLICKELKDDKVLEKLHEDKEIGSLYWILAGALTLNEDGREKVIQYLLDMHKIFEYRRDGDRIIERKIKLHSKEETSCPEGAPQTAAECSPASDQMDDGNADTRRV